MNTNSIKRWVVNLSLTASFLLPAHVSANAISVMPVGDSITQGVRGECGYRRALSQALAKNPGCAVNFVGSRSGAGDNSNVQTDVCAAQNNPHEATPGIQAEQLLTKIDSRITTYQPDVVLLHAGSNDIYNDRTVADTLADVSTLIDRVFIKQPNATVVLSNVIPWSEESPDPLFYKSFEKSNRDMFADTSHLSAGLASIASAKASAGKSVELADVRSNFDSDLMTIDGVHPNPVGEAHIANKMVNALYKLGACGGQQIDVQPPITYINVPATQDTVLPLNFTVSGTVIDEGGSGISQVVVAIQNSAGRWLQKSGKFETDIDMNVVATLSNNVTNSSDWSFSTNLITGDYRLHVLALDSNGNQVEEAAGTGLPRENDKVWTSRTFRVTAQETAVPTPKIFPKHGSGLSAKYEVFSWEDMGPEIVEYRLSVGSTIGSVDYYNNTNLGKATYAIVTGLPTDGSAVEVRFWFRKAQGDWQYVDKSYTAASGNKRGRWGRRGLGFW